MPNLTNIVIVKMSRRARDGNGILCCYTRIEKQQVNLCSKDIEDSPVPS